MILKSSKSKNCIGLLTNFSGLRLERTNDYYITLIRLKKLKIELYFINAEYLSFQKIITKKVNYDKRFKYFEPKNFNEFNDFIKKKKILIINNIGRGFNYFFLLFFLKIKNLHQIRITNLGNIQSDQNEFRVAESNFLFHLKYQFFRTLPRKIGSLFIFLGLFNKINCRFLSDSRIYKNFQNTNYLKKKFLFYKKIELVKSNLYEEKISKRDMSENLIVLLDLYPYYYEIKRWGMLNEKKVKLHYKQLNFLLDKLAFLYKKEAVVSIHPGYPENFYKNIFPNKKVIKYKTKSLIKKSFIVLFFDSSAILTAIKLNKKIISIESDLFKGKRYNSEVYSGHLKNMKIRLDKKYKFEKISLLRKLNKKVDNYKIFKNKFLGFHKKESGSNEIIKYIKEFFYKKKINEKS